MLTDHQEGSHALDDDAGVFRVSEDCLTKVTRVPGRTRREEKGMPESDGICACRHDGGTVYATPVFSSFSSKVVGVICYVFIPLRGVQS